MKGLLGIAGVQGKPMTGCPGPMAIPGKPPPMKPPQGSKPTAVALAGLRAGPVVAGQAEGPLLAALANGPVPAELVSCVAVPAELANCVAVPDTSSLLKNFARNAASEVCIFSRKSMSSPPVATAAQAEPALGPSIL